jgi:biotin operon repressor
MTTDLSSEIPKEEEERINDNIQQLQEQGYDINKDPEAKF